MKFLVAIYRPDGYDGSVEGPDVAKAIDDVNDEMVAAGVRVFVGGFQPPESARSIRLGSDGEVESVRDGIYLQTGEFAGGCWILDVQDHDEAVEWGKKAARACRAHVEVRPFH